MQKLILILIFSVFAWGEDKTTGEIYQKMFRLLGQARTQETSTPALAPLNVARVDLTLLHLFHPAMKEYNFAQARFYRADILIGKNPLSRLQAIQNERLKFQTENSRKLLELDQTTRNLNNQINQLKQQILDLSKGAGESLKKTEEEHWGRIFALQKQIEELRASYITWSNQAGKKIFLSLLETEQRLKSIASEITSSIQEVATDRKFQIVLNSPLRKAPEFLLNAEEPLLVRAASESNTLNDFMLQRFFFGENDKGATSENFEKVLKSYLDRYSLIQARFEPFLNGSDLVGVNVDLTRDVLLRIWAQNELPKSIQDKLIQALAL